MADNNSQSILLSEYGLGSSYPINNKINDSNLNKNKINKEIKEINNKNKLNYLKNLNKNCLLNKLKVFNYSNKSFNPIYSTTSISKLFKPIIATSLLLGSIALGEDSSSCSSSSSCPSVSVDGSSVSWSSDSNNDIVKNGELNWNLSGNTYTPKNDKSPAQTLEAI